MKPRMLLFAVGLGILTALGAHGQGTFRNLDFESARIVPVSGGDVSWSAAMPYWTGYIGGIPVDRLHHNGIGLSLASMGILGPDFAPPGYFQGHYLIDLKPGLDPGGSGQIVLTEIAQSGTIPLGSQSIEFYAFAAAFYVTFAGHEIPLTEIGGSYSTNFVYGGDISAFAGQTGELRFAGGGYLDDIQFSTEPIPEPGVFGLSALGAVLFGWRVLRRGR